MRYFTTVFNIWQLVYMIQRFLFPHYKEIYICKLVKLPPVDPYACIHPAKVLFLSRGLEGPLWEALV